MAACHSTAALLPGERDEKRDERFAPPLLRDPGCRERDQYHGYGQGKEYIQENNCPNLSFREQIEAAKKIISVPVSIISPAEIMDRRWHRQSFFLLFMRKEEVSGDTTARVNSGVDARP
jgi:hypothetical protein